MTEELPFGPGHPKFAQMLRMMLDPAMLAAGAKLRAIADIDVPPSDTQIFSSFVEWINTRPKFIAHWRDDPVREQRDYPRFMALSDHVRDAYTAVYYHLNRVEELEEKVRRVLEEYRFSDFMVSGSVATLGRMRVADIEYQGFIFAYRRCLDYLSTGVSTYFGTHCSSFRELGKKLPKWAPQSVAHTIHDCYTRHRQQFDFVMADERGKSVRDRLAHREFVQAACVNVSKSGFRLVGGGEELGIRGNDVHLAQALHIRVDALRAFLGDFYVTFQNAVIAEEA
jgi:hypothetical protein